VKEAKNEDRKRILTEGLKKVTLPSKFQLPLDPRLEASGLIVEKCKFMDSKKLPLWLVFENAEKRGHPIYVIFKAGDDLRQDVLTLQMLRIMDKLWKSEGLDLRLNAYGCVATGDELGMIEVVLNAHTTASINKQRGGSKAVLYKDTLSQWLRQKNPSGMYIHRGSSISCLINKFKSLIYCLFNQNNYFPFLLMLLIFSCGVRESCRDVHVELRRVLRGDLRAGNRRSSQRQHHAHRERYASSSPFI
jgi:hypothetical protein